MIMIIITIRNINVEYIWLPSLQTMQIKVSSAVGHDFNQLMYALPRPADLDSFPAPPCFLALPGPSSP